LGNEKVKLKRLIILPLIALIFSTINVLPAFAALGDDWDATASGLRENTPSWVASKISNNGTIQVAITYDSVYISSDTGNTWTNKLTTDKYLDGLDISDDGSTIVLSYSAGANGSFLVSKDYGQTWTDSTPVGRSASNNAVSIPDFALSSDGNTIVAFTNDGRFFHSSDSGVTWSAPIYPTDVTDPYAMEISAAFYGMTTGQTHDRWKSIDISSDGGSLVIGGGGVGVKVSTDLGATWSFVINDSLNWTNVAFGNNSSTIFAQTWDDGGGKGLIKISTDAGQTFSNASCALTPETSCINSGFGGPIVWSNFATSADGSKMIAIGNTGESAGYPKQIYVSADQGLNWTLTDLEPTYWRFVSSDSSGNNLLVTGLGTQIFTSHDAGLTWNTISIGLVPASYYWYDVEASSDGKYMYANRDNSALFKSSDYGATWSNTNAPGFYPDGNSSIATSSNGATVITTSNFDYYGCFYLQDNSKCSARLLKSNDYGQNWTSVDIPGVVYYTSLSISNDGQTQVANAGLYNFDTEVAQYKIYVSRDSGQTWIERFEQSQEDMNTAELYNISISGDGQKMIVSTSGNYYYISTDYGVEWERLVLPEALGYFQTYYKNNFAITSDGSKIYALTYNGLFLSQDMGLTWSENSLAPEPEDSYSDFKLNQDGSGILLADYDRKVLFSENSGQTWNTIFNAEGDYYLLAITAAQDFSTVAFSTESDVYISHNSSFVPNSTPTSSSNNNSGSTTPTPTPTPINNPKIEDIKELIEKIKEAKEEEKEELKPGTIAAAEPLIMRLIEDLPVILKPQIVNIFTEEPVANQILDIKKALDILKEIVDKVVVDLPSLVRIGGEIQASRLVVVNNTSLQLVTADGGVLSVQANDGENPIPVDKSGKVQMVRSNGVETKGVGLSPNSEFSVYLFSDPTLLGIGKADAQGSFNASFLVDKDFPLGNHTLQINGVLANGKTSSISMPVSVVESVETATTQAMTKAVAEVKTTNSNSYIVFLLIMLALIGSIIIFKGPRFIYDQFKQRIE
jgi:photosystem II stability/assembly factor-like uncharacterized protein